MSSSDTPATFPDDENRWATQTAARLRLVQATCADESRETRESYLGEELGRLLEDVPPGKRQMYLDTLADKFPTWHRTVTTAPFAVPSVRGPETAEELMQAVARLAPKFTAEERQRLREKLVECGVVEAAAAQSVDGFAAFRKQAMLAPADTIAPARLEKLLIQELEFLAKLDQLAWTTWKMLAPKSALKRDTSLGDFRAVLRRYLKGDAEVNDLQLAQAIERTRQLVAILLGSISQVGRGFTKRYQTRYAPDAIRELVKMEGGSMLLGQDTKCWRKYCDLASEISEASIQNEMQEMVVKYVEDLMRGNAWTAV